MAHDHAPHDLICQLADGTRLTMQRDVADRLVVTAYAPAANAKYPAPVIGALVVGFGPWPSWEPNLRNGVATLPDDESGLFEPERLFVLREQYAFTTPADPHAKPSSFGPIDKVWWEGTQHIVQARQKTARH